MKTGAMVEGGRYIWQGKREFVFLQRMGEMFYFSCADFIDADDPQGIASLTRFGLKDLVEAGHVSK